MMIGVKLIFIIIIFANTQFKVQNEHNHEDFCIFDDITIINR